MAYRKERSRLRFFGLSAEKEGSIRTALPGVEFKARRPSLPRVTKIFLLDLHEAMNLSSLHATLDTLQLEPDQFEVVASVVTTSDNGGIDLPKYILNLIKQTRCGVRFPFVSTGPDEPEADPAPQPEIVQ